MCLGCHAIDGAGPPLGPSFDGIGARLGAEGIRTGILDPAAGASPGYEAMVGCFEAGLTVRQAGDFIALSPPLIINEAQIHRIAEILRQVISSLD